MFDFCPVCREILVQTELKTVSGVVLGPAIGCVNQHYAKQILPDRGIGIYIVEGVGYTVSAMSSRKIWSEDESKVSQACFTARRRWLNEFK